MRELEPPLEALQNPLLMWERRDGGTTTSEESSDRDTLETSGESVLEPPSAKRTRRIELVHVPKRVFGPPNDNTPVRGYGPPSPPPEEDGEVPPHERTQKDRVRLLKVRLTANAIEIDRRDSIEAKNLAVETSGGT
eukprot:3461283-Amphidinium_carterae.1